MAISTDLFEMKTVIQKAWDAFFKIEDWATAGLLTGESHRKQYCLEQILIAMGIDLTELRTKLNVEGYDWESGIAP